MATLYQFLYDPGQGYVVFRCGEDDKPADRLTFAKDHKQAVFVTEMAAIDYCAYRNHYVDVNGDDRVPTTLQHS